MDDNQLILGRIQEINDCNLKVSLPNFKKGNCSIVNISDSYNSVLEKKNESEKEVLNEKPLKQIYKIGQFLQFKVIEEKQGIVRLRAIPKDLNGSVIIEEINPSMVLQMAIKSIEDHGYLLESGITDLYAFLPFEKAESKSLNVGELVSVALDGKLPTEKKCIVNFTNLSKDINKREVTSSDKICFEALLPGLMISAELHKDRDQLAGSINGFKIFVKSENYDSKIWKQSQTSKMRIIRRIGENKLIECSLMPHVMNDYKFSYDINAVELGYLEKESIIKSIKSNGDFTVRVRKENYPDILIVSSKIPLEHKSKQVGDHIPVRVTHFNLMENITQGSSMKGILDQPYYTIKEAKVGDFIEVTVICYDKKGYKVKVSQRVNGFIQDIFVMDETKDKFFNQIYKPKSKIKCQVIYVNNDRNTIGLTSRKSIMTSKLPKDLSYKTLEVGTIIDGVVCMIKKQGVIFKMCGNLMGYLPMDPKVTNFSFKTGKYFKVAPIFVDREKEKIRLRLVDTYETPEDIKMAYDVQTKIDIGSVFKCVVDRTLKSAFNVILKPINRRAILPFTQLSDSVENSKLFELILQKENQIELEVVITSEKDNFYKVSARKSLIEAVQNNSNMFLKDKSNYLVDEKYYGWINKVVDFGLFVELPSGVEGLVALKHVENNKKESLELIYKQGQTVCVKALSCENDKDKKRCSFTMKMMDTYSAAENLSESFQYVKQCLDERDLIKESGLCKAIQNVKIGDLVEVCKVEIGDIKTDLIVKLADGNVIEGFVRNRLNQSVEMEEDNWYKAVVLDFDLITEKVEVCMSKSLVSSSLNNRNINIKTGSKVLEFNVLVVNPDYVIGHFMKFANGLLAVVPNKRYWNDSKDDWLNDQKHKVVLKDQLSEFLYLVGLRTNEALNAQETTMKLKSNILAAKKMPCEKIQLSVGDKYDAYFRKLSAHQMELFLTKKQKANCDILDYTNDLEEMISLMSYHPRKNSLLPKKAKILQAIKKKIQVSFLDGVDLSVGDVYLGKVIAVFNSKSLRIKLPFNNICDVNLNEGKHFILTPPEVGSLLICRVKNIINRHSGKKSISVIIEKSYSKKEKSGNLPKNRKDSSDEVSEEVPNTMEVDEEIDDEVDEEVDGEEAVEDEKNSNVLSSESEGEEDEEDKINLKVVETRDVYEDDCYDDDFMNEEVEEKSVNKKRIREESVDDKDDEEIEAPVTKKKRNFDMDNVIEMREAETRLQTGDAMRNPRTLNEFEFNVHNNPNQVNNWVKYLFYLRKSMNSDSNTNNSNDYSKKFNEIRNRALISIDDQDKESRWKIMEIVLDVEFDRLKKQTDLGKDFDDLWNDFNSVFVKALNTKTEKCYEHSIKVLMEHNLKEFAEKIIKNYVKDFKEKVSPWYYLCLIRYNAKDYNLIKQTLINARSVLKKVAARQLIMKLVELELGNKQNNAAYNYCCCLVQDKPNDQTTNDKIKQLLTQHLMMEELQQITAQMQTPAK